MDYKYSLYTMDVRPSAELSVYQFGYETCLEGQSYGPTIRDYYLIHYIVSGKGSYTVNDKTYELAENDGFLIPPGVKTFYCADTNEPWTYYWVGFNGTEAKRILNHAHLNEHNVVFNYKIDNRLIDILYTITQTVNAAENVEYSSLGYLYRFLAILIAKHNLEDETGKKSSESYSSRAIRYIEENYTKNLKVSDITKMLKIDRSHLFRIFKEDLQISPQQYILKFRLNKACTLLRSSNFSLGEISELLQFSDPMYFARIFKKHLNISPSAYRKHPFESNMDITGNIQKVD
jgi:AraC-like DNA-binding protein